MLVGVGVGAVLMARLGSDGYSTAIYGISHRTGLPYALANWAVALACVLCAWVRRVPPRPGTITHPLVVGATVDLVLHLGVPPTLAARISLLVVGTVILSAGVALYLSASLGSGPFESLAFAAPAVSFRVAYMALQAAGTCIGWLLGAPIGPGTPLIVFGVGPLVAIFRRHLPGNAVVSGR